MLQATFRLEHDVIVVSLVGNATEALASPVPELMRYVAKSPRGIVINMRGVHYINSAGLSAIIATFREAAKRNVPMAFCELQPPVLKVFKLARVEIFMPTFDAEAMALKFFGVGAGGTRDGGTVPLPRENILVVETQLEISEHLRGIFTKLHDAPNYKITALDDASQVTNWLKTKRFHAILVDIFIPRAQIEALILHCRTALDTPVMPIIIVSPEQKFAEADYYIRYGADEMLRFPFNLYEVSTRIRSVISASKSFQEQQEAVQLAG